MREGLKQSIEAETACYPNDSYGVARFIVSNRTRNSTSLNPLKVYANFVLPLTPGMNREFWEMMSGISLELREDGRLYREIFRRIFPEVASIPVCTGGKLIGLTPWQDRHFWLDKARRVLGWSYGPRKDVRLTLAALNNAVRNRRWARRVVFHTDRGIEYAAGAFKQRLAGLGFIQSMNRPGKVTDNAFIESFFHSMKSELFHGCRFDRDEQVRIALMRYMPFYNQHRLHSSLNYVSPAAYERQAR